MKPKVAFIGTGGTISSLGEGPLDIMDYVRHDRRLHADEIVARYPELAEVAEVIPVRFRNVPSFDIFFPEWRELVAAVRRDRCKSPRPRRHRHRPRHRLARRNGLDAEPDGQGGRAGGGGRLAAAGERLVVGCRDEPAQRGAHRGRAGIARARRAGAAQRRNPGGAGRDEDLHLPHADLPHAGFRRARPCRCRPHRLLPARRTPHGARHRVRHPHARCACRAWTSPMPTPDRTAPRCAPSSPRARGASSRPASRPAFPVPPTARRWNRP